VSDEVHKLGEVLRAAREAKGVDLVRVERETKIRERYLSALERGEYRELPGSVYTRGFLRNYGAYLGLDPEYLIDLYRLETSTSLERPRLPTPPRPLATRGSRALVITPGAIVAAILTLMVGGFVAWIGFEFVNFARTPELRITDPAGNVSDYMELTITVRGTTAPNARVTVSNLRENPTVQADAQGDFVMTVGLVPGSNVMRLVAHDPVTGRDSEPEERTIIVVTDVASSPSPGPQLTLAQPAQDAVVPPGPVAISGTGAPATTVSVSATLVTPAVPDFLVTTPSGAPVDIGSAAPAAPAPLSLTAAADGTFVGQLPLAAGVWDLSVSDDSADTLSRQVTVAPSGGLTATLQISGGDSYLVLEEDGTAVSDRSDTIAVDGDTITLQATESLRVRVGNAGAVRITINGIGIGLMGGDAEVVEWRVARREG
jgi:cytoskeletal protein RodZ